jgi:hypothetical protein
MELPGRLASPWSGPRPGGVLSCLSWLTVRDFDYLLKRTDTSITNDPTSGAELMLAHAFFPGSNSYSDTMLGLTEVTRRFSRDGNATLTAARAIVHVGDGVSNGTTSECDSTQDANGPTSTWLTAACRA